MLSAAALRDLWKAHHKELRQIPIRDKSQVLKYAETLEKFKEGALKNLEATVDRQNVHKLYPLLSFYVDLHRASRNPSWRGRYLRR